MAFRLYSRGDVTSCVILRSEVTKDLYQKTVSAIARRLFHVLFFRFVRGVFENVAGLAVQRFTDGDER